MSVIAEVVVPAEDFELGRIMELEPEMRIELERMVPLGESAVPLIWRYDAGGEAFEEAVRSHPSVEAFEVVESFEDRTLYAIEWGLKSDHFLTGINAQDAQLLNGTGSASGWEFEIRFPDHEALSTFRDHCANAKIRLEVLRVFNPGPPDIGPWFGLTDPQREALLLAVEEGYYDVPRGCTTIELAERLDISDQAVTERLRRGIDTLVRNTLVVANRDPALSTMPNDDI